MFKLLTVPMYLQFLVGNVIFEVEGTDLSLSRIRI